ncbi:MAG: class I SAM-dependent methyltransferase [Acidimicrobiales bacterium]|jgi:SAM-dependent methyltransferase
MPPFSPNVENLREYRRKARVDEYRLRAGWADAGERIMVNKIADEVRSEPILDIGVGGGRTAWMLRPLSSGYVAVDYSPEMVEACRQAYPGLDVREGDARNLSMFDDEAFSFVFFSFNGIDSLDHEARLVTLAEMLRVLRRGGLLLYSTLNRNGPWYHRPPWAIPITWNERLPRLLRFLRRLPSSMPRYRLKYQNWWHFRNCQEDHGSWAIGTMFSYLGELLAHWSLPSTERQVLGSLGSSVLEFRSPEGEPITDNVTVPAYFYVLARKNATLDPEGTP